MIMKETTFNIDTDMEIASSYFMSLMLSSFSFWKKLLVPVMIIYFNFAERFILISIIFLNLMELAW